MYQVKIKWKKLTHGLHGALGKNAVQHVDGKVECTTEVVNARRQIAMIVLGQMFKEDSAL